jgi:hypothetical protein
MKIKRKKSLKIGQMPEHLRKAAIKIQIPKESALSSLEKVAKKAFHETIDKIGESYEALDEEVKSKAKELETGKKAIKELAEDRGESDGKFRVLRGKKYEIGYVNADQEPDINLKVWNIIHPDIRARCERRIIDKKLLENVINKGTILPSVVSKLFIPKPPQKRIHVQRIK